MASGKANKQSEKLGDHRMRSPRLLLTHRIIPSPLIYRKYLPGGLNSWARCTESNSPLDSPEEVLNSLLFNLPLFYIVIRNFQRNFGHFTNKSSLNFCFLCYRIVFL